MNALYRLLVRLRAVLLFVVLEVIALLLLSNSSYYQQSKMVGSIRIAKGVADARLEAWQHYFSLKETNDRLALENNALRNRLEYYKMWADTAKTVVLDSLSQPVYSYIPAIVVSNSVNTRHNYITLNIGSRQGVTKDMGVIAHNGIIGIVDYVTEHYSLVLSLLNRECRVSAKLANEGSFGSLHWDDGLSYHEMLLSDIPRHIPITIGDTIVSSGFSGFFPLGIPIGTVKKVTTRQGVSHEITVTLFADFKKLHHVNVVNHKYRNELNEIKEKENEKKMEVPL